MPEIMRFNCGDILEMKKPHPCGSKRFVCIRLGSDIRIVCEGCKRDLTIERIKLEKAIKRVIPNESEGSFK